MLIISLKPNVSRDRATVMFRGGLRRLRHGQLRIAADFYIPYHLFKLTWDNRQATTEGIMAVDAATGRLDPYQFDERPAEPQRLSVETTRFSPARVSEQEAGRIVEEQMMRHRLMKGFIKLAMIKSSVSYLECIYLPYWVGVYERNDLAHLEVIGALQGRFEGAKVREIVAEWFRIEERG